MLLRLLTMTVVALRVAAVRRALLIPSVVLRDAGRRGEWRRLVLLVTEGVGRGRRRQASAARFVRLAKTANVGSFLFRERRVSSERSSAVGDGVGAARASTRVSRSAMRDQPS